MTQAPEQTPRYDRTVDPTEQVIASQAWLDKAAVPLQKAIVGFYEGGGKVTRRLEDFLHGKYVGTPLHPILVTIPIGAWSVAAVLDFLELRGRKDVRAGSDLAVAVGLVGGMAAIATGWTDWARGGDSPVKRRVGFVHGSLNETAFLLYAGSYLLRGGKARATARGIGWLAYMVSGMSAHLGGTLVYKEGLGVSHTADLRPPDGFVPVLAEADLPENTPTRAEAGEVPVLLVRQGETVYALAETCSHLGGPLSEGRIEGDAIRCPWHGSLFRLSDGYVLESPSAHAQPCFVTRVRDGQIEVRPGRSWD
ncbi:Rieske 2Fe-2S domain-containing protein [Deinococcus planocerae]|uniref:Rieske 2Fe-2S domain-containing protein n=1 Tax=Deinococcus planocerae TaxID=1737569 RepID=UPI000C7E8D90|nr:Rieske 2Fe-2S domain-containing protein [Deinococcus planocerae]